jgi:hypothetical protein
VEVIVHQAVGIDLDVKFFPQPAKQLDKLETIWVSQVNGVAVIPP